MGSYYHVSNSGIDIPEWSYDEMPNCRNIIKPINEACGLNPVVDDSLETDRVLYEKMISNSGLDHKVYVMNFEEPRAFGAIKRSKLHHEDEKRISFDPIPEMREISFKASEALNARILGIDFIIEEGTEEVWPVEFNSNPSFCGTGAIPNLLDNFEKLHGQI